MNRIINFKIDKVIQEYSNYELALGFLRYEALRKLNPHQFTELHKKNIRGEVIFDDAITNLIK